MSSNGDAKTGGESKTDKQPEAAAVAKLAATEKTAKSEESKDSKLNANGDNTKKLDTKSGESEKQSKDTKENGKIFVLLNTRVDGIYSKKPDSAVSHAIK